MVNKYPYTDFHEMNLDWFLEEFKKVHDHVDDLDATVQEFTTFVTNYFANLDLQEEVNIKLNEMVADGTLANLIQPLFDEYKEEIDADIANQNARIAAFGPEITQLTARVDQLATIDPGSITTTADAELVDIRVGYDGTTYASAGDSVRNQVSDLHDITGYGKFVQNGVDVSSQYYKTFEPLEQGVTYVLEVTSTTTGTFDLQAGTAVSGSAIVDDIAMGESFTANVSKKFDYTPSVSGIIAARLWIATAWSVVIYKKISLWDESYNQESKISDVENDLYDINRALNQAFEIERTKNLFDFENRLQGKYYLSDGTLTSNATWNTTNKIEMANGDVLRFSANNNGTRLFENMWFLIVFDTNDQVINYVNTGATSFTASEDCYVYFSYTASKESTEDDFFAGLNINNANYYEPYGYNYTAKNSLNVQSYKGKTWACVGDSITEVNSKANKHYYDYIAEELGFSVLNYGLSGSGYAAKMQTNQAFFQRIAALSDNFDVLTIFGSVNDISVLNSMPLGSYTDSGTDTMAGCINTAIDNFYTVAPYKKFGIISQPPSIGTANNGNLIETVAQQYNDMLQQICKNRGIPFLNMFNQSGLRPWDADYRTEYYYENGSQDAGVHPNSKGQKQMSTLIREFIKEII